MVNHSAAGRKEITVLILLLRSLKSAPSAVLVPTLALELLFPFPIHSTLALKGWQLGFSHCSSSSVTSAF